MMLDAYDPRDVILKGEPMQYLIRNMLVTFDDSIKETL